MIIDSSFISTSTYEKEATKLGGSSEPRKSELESDDSARNVESLWRMEFEVENGIGALNGSAHSLG